MKPKETAFKFGYINILTFFSGGGGLFCVPLGGCKWETYPALRPQD